MTKERAKKLKAGRPGETVYVRGTVREVNDIEDGFIEVQFENYSLNIPLKDVRPS
jgi:hypothetical protein